jgi:diguanylate cyclase (GGDEF)-like protein
VVTYLDITECKRKEERLVRLAYHDELTQLPNRRLLQDRLSYAIERQDRTEKTGALLFVDIDHFKDVNDIYGHDVGDLLLKEVAVRLTSCIRKSDTAARIGGDEFIIVLIEDLGLDNKNVVKIAEKIRESIEKPFYIENNTLTITVSIGVTLFHKDCTVDELLKRSDNALYKAKQAGRNIIEFYQPNEEEINNA